MFKFLILKNSIKIEATLILLYTLLGLAKPLSAKMVSEDYELQMPNLNFSSGSMSSSGINLGFTGGQTASGEYSRDGYRLLAGFWYLKTIIPFTFTVSNQVVEFSSLSAGVPSDSTTTLSVSSGGTGGYQVTAQENHQLMVYSTGGLIADTTGDNGDITYSNAGAWENNTTYGFGYTLHGQDVPTPFPTAAPANNYYKQFSDTSKGEDPEIVMHSDNVGKNRTATVTYKINVSFSQPAGRYHNVITYIATPTY